MYVYIIFFNIYIYIYISDSKYCVLVVHACSQLYGHTLAENTGFCPKSTNLLEAHHFGPQCHFGMSA